MYKPFLFTTVLILSVIVNVHAQVVFPLKISSDERYLVDQKNKPFPILGRTAWFIMSQPDSGYKKFLANTLEHGHNAIEMSVITHWAMGNHSPFNANGDAPFLKCLNGNNWDGKLIYTDIKTEGPNLLTPNENYWKHIDELLAYCESKGILVFMFPGYVGYSSETEEQGWMQELVANGTERTEQYGAWIATRYKNQKNIVWM
jgi:hypothetical protein